jgi:hypothetical protein
MGCGGNGVHRVGKRGPMIPRYGRRQSKIYAAKYMIVDIYYSGKLSYLPVT